MIMQPQPNISYVHRYLRYSRFVETIFALQQLIMKYDTIQLAAGFGIRDTSHRGHPAETSAAPDNGITWMLISAASMMRYVLQIMNNHMLCDLAEATDIVANCRNER